MKNSDKIGIPDNTIICVVSRGQFQDVYRALGYKDMIDSLDNNKYVTSTKIGIRINNNLYNPINYYMRFKLNIISFEEFKDKWLAYLNRRTAKHIVDIETMVNRNFITYCTEQVINEKEINKVMNENLSLVEILKDCPKGTKLYSTIYGEVEFSKICNEESAIKFYINTSYTASVCSKGKHNIQYDGECTLFPSKDQKDWSKFKVLVNYIDGEVYISEDGIFISNGKISDRMSHAYCGYMYFNNTFAISDQISHWTNKDCKPATKEQRRDFFQKMNEAGYSWDNSSNKVIPYIKIGSQVMCADNPEFWNLRTYNGNRKTKEGKYDSVNWNYIILLSKFNFDDLESNIKNSI